ncbi:carbohydrate ABC transporter permease [Gemmiger formicilis]|uniref:carbohydrate ABC transporter permease n=1 Tax=Gemmiger formicilis TaxID=745368 RepID=UPI00195B9254|nr:carbohydrate ABC transporter permease [Gemmiger formicilis]MBM6715337.1 carbohydrate ABC transporter permease [Gemmiger formicilis]
MDTKFKRNLSAAGSRVLLLYLPLAVFLVFTLFPFYWIVNTSLKDSVDVLSIPIQYWPQNPTFENYIYLFQKMGFGNNVKNTFFVAILTTVFVTLLSLLAGYAMSRYRFRGKGVVYVLMLVTQMLPAVVLMIPLFQTMVSLNLINNLWSLVLICTCTNLPFCMFMMMGYYNSVPNELEEAAQVDGCTLLGAVFRILIPVMLPSIVATGAYAFINAWNVYVYATAFITDRTKYTLPLALNVFQGEYGTDYGLLAAGCVIALLPVIIIFAFIQKHLSGGATSGAVKG